MRVAGDEWERGDSSIIYHFPSLPLDGGANHQLTVPSLVVCTFPAVIVRVGSDFLVEVFDLLCNKELSAIEI